MIKMIYKRSTLKWTRTRSVSTRSLRGRSLRRGSLNRTEHRPPRPSYSQIPAHLKHIHLHDIWKYQWTRLFQKTPMNRYSFIINNKWMHTFDILRITKKKLQNKLRGIGSCTSAECWPASCCVRGTCMCNLYSESVLLNRRVNPTVNCYHCYDG